MKADNWKNCILFDGEYEFQTKYARKQGVIFNGFYKVQWRVLISIPLIHFISAMSLAELQAPILATSINTLCPVSNHE